MTVHDPVVCFGKFRLDIAARELRDGETPVDLQPRVFDLLAYLVAHRERAVDKNEIQDAVWRGRIVSETALTRAIMKARRAVGDSADQQAMIRTVHGHGYQFVGAVESTSAPASRGDPGPAPPPDPDPVSPASQTAAEPRRASVQRGLGVMAILAGVAAVAIWLWPNRVPEDGARIAVAPVINAVDDDEYTWASLGLMGVANDLLRGAADLDVVPPADVVRYADAVNWPATLRSDHAEHARALARQFGATHLLVSELTRNAGALRLSYVLVDAAGAVDDGTMVGARSTELIKGMVRGIGTRLTARRHYSENALAVTGDPFVDEAYARGMSLALAGRCAEALPHFDVVTDAVGDLINVRLERAECAQVLGQWEDAQAEFEALLAQMETGGTGTSLRAEVLSGLANVHHRTGRVATANHLYERALGDARDASDGPLTGRILIGLAIMAKDRHEFAQGRDLLARATLALRDAGVEQLPGQLYSTQANIAMNDGKLDQAEGFLDSALASYRAAGDRRREALVLNNYGYLRRVQGRLAEAEPLHLQSLAIREDIGDRVGQGRIHGMLSVLYEARGDYERALNSARAGVSIARDARDALFTATGLSQQGAAELGLGRLDDARGSFEEAERIFESIGDRSRVWQVQVRLAAIDLAAGQLDAARTRAAGLIQPASEAGLHEAAIEARELLGDIAQAAGNASGAVEQYGSALADIERTGFAHSRRQDILIKLATLYLDRDDTDAAEPLVGRALDGDPSLPLSRLQARFAFARGDASRAARLLSEARDAAGTRWTSDDDDALARYTAPNN